MANFSLLQEPERFADGFRGVAVRAHVGHPLADHGDREVAEPLAADVPLDQARLVAVPFDRGGLDGAARLLVREERVHELLHGDGAADRPALAFHLKNELVASPLGRLPGLAFHRVVAGHLFAGDGVRMGQGHLPAVGVAAPAQPSARVLHSSSVRSFPQLLPTNIFTNIGTDK